MIDKELKIILLKRDSIEGNYFNDPTNNKNWGEMKLSKRI